MDKEIEEFKKNQGTVTYSVKELLGGVHTKLDNIYSKLSDGKEKFAEIETAIRYHKKLIYALYSVLFVLLLAVLNLYEVI